MTRSSVQMPPADISLKRVSRTYALGDEEIYALSDVSLDIAQGKFVAVRGPSGLGKSTLANVIGGLDTPNSGSVIVGGLDPVEALRYE